MSAGTEELDLITRAEAAEILTVSEKTVKKLIAAGVLPAYRISPSCTRLRRREVLAYIEERRVKVRKLQKRPTGVKDLRRQQQIRELGSGYVPGMKVVAP